MGSFLELFIKSLGFRVVDKIKNDVLILCYDYQLHVLPLYHLSYLSYLEDQRNLKIYNTKLK